MNKIHFYNNRLNVYFGFLIFFVNYYSHYKSPINKAVKYFAKISTRQLSSNIPNLIFGRNMYPVKGYFFHLVTKSYISTRIIILRDE